MLICELYNLLIIVFQIFICYRSSIDLKSLIDMYKMWRCEESYLFSKTFPENLREHLTYTSFAIASCHMKH